MTVIDTKLYKVKGLFWTTFEKLVYIYRKCFCYEINATKGYTSIHPEYLWELLKCKNGKYTYWKTSKPETQSG